MFKKLSALLLSLVIVTGIVTFVSFQFNNHNTPKQPTPKKSPNAPVVSAKQIEINGGITETNASAKPTIIDWPKQPYVEVQTARGKVTRPNLEYHVQYTPNDAVQSQWYTDKISAPATWDKSTGSAETTVAVIDTGFALNHNELFDRWEINTAEYGNGKESNNVDDDGNGYVDDWRGWDFYHRDNNPNAGSTNTSGSGVSHGTSTSGLVGAAGNNSVGVASVNWQTRILPLQALDDDGVGYTLTVAAAMRYAVDRGVDVISLSLGTSSPDETIKDEIDYATANNVLVVAAAGNDGCNCMVYPANYSEVLSVGATDQNDSVASFSSYGANLDVVAPGSGSIVAPRWIAGDQQNSYSSSLYGTSFSTPIVSGLAALLKSLNSNYTPVALTALIKNNADVLSSTRSGAGRVNALRSVTTARPDLPKQPPPLFAPYFKLSKSGASDIFTENLDIMNKQILDGYQYSILRYTKQ